jgi:plasmid maintenance system killer protein
MHIAFAPQFQRQFKKLPKALQEESFDKIELFKNPKNHPALRVHKLKGELSGKLSFSVNYRYRIVFIWEITNKSAILMAIGDHTVYE